MILKSSDNTEKAARMMGIIMAVPKVSEKRCGEHLALMKYSWIKKLRVGKYVLNFK